MLNNRGSAGILVVGNWRGGDSAYVARQPIEWLDGVVPSMATSVVRVLSYVDLRFAEDEALRAASDWVQHNPTLLPGFSLQLTIKDSKCSAANTLADMGEVLKSDNNVPHIAVGYGW